MIIAKVVGNVWATKKDDRLNGLKLLVVEPAYKKGDDGGPFVAVDVVGAGIGEDVLVVKGSTARAALAVSGAPVDASVVGIIDTVEVDERFL